MADTQTENALRVVLGVVELQRMERSDAMLSRLMQAYHFQQSLRRFSDACLEEANQHAYDETPHVVHEIYRVEPHKQMVVTIFPCGWDSSPASDPIRNLLFVEPSLSDESYIVRDDLVVPLGDLDKLAALLEAHPSVFETYMQVCFRPHRLYCYDTPDATILSVE